MVLRSLALQTDLIFARFSGQVLDRGEYMVVKTPSHPDYFWGNYLIMPETPGEGSLAQWRSLYNREFDANKQGFMTFAIDAPEGNPGSVQPFIAAGFQVKTNKVLTAKSVHSPPQLNEDAEVREIRTEHEWEQLIDVHYSDEWYLKPESQIPFLTERMKVLRKMCESGLGKRFGAFLDGRVVADLGIFHSGNLGRFNEVATHRSHRRKGLCGTLVYKSASFALETMGIETLVMEADENYHAAAIYESVGFLPTQRQIGLEWHDKNIHG